MNIYFDNAATTAVCPEATQAAVYAMNEACGNPSSLHTMGMEAEHLLTRAKDAVLSALGKPRGTLYFTSGGTESDNLAIIGAVTRNAHKRRTVITTEIEHPAVSEAFAYLGMMGYNILKIKTLPCGSIDLNSLNDLLSHDTVLVSIMHVNNETGVIQPLDEAVRLIRQKAPDALVHSDMVQSFGKLKMPDVDLASISGHKIHAPKGVGALFVRDRVLINPLLFGGGQQNSVRPGTENVPGISAFGAAAEAISQNDAQITSAVKSRLIELIEAEIPDIKINGENTVGSTLNVSFRGTRSEILLHSLEAEGIMVSSGSACSSNKPSPSHVLTAMGLAPSLVDSAIRFSFSRFNTINEAEKCAEVLTRAVSQIRRMMK